MICKFFYPAMPTFDGGGDDFRKKEKKTIAYVML